MTNDETIQMMAEYMEKGFLDNIEDMLKHDPSLFGVLPLMITDERYRVRIGAVSIAETMRLTHMQKLREQIPAIAEHLKNEHPTYRGDVIYLLSAIGHADVLPFLKEHKEDHPQVREMLEETIEELEEETS